MNANKYKTVLCKHFGQTGTCSYADKCQFAHGFQELKNTTSTPIIGGVETKITKQPPNPSNFKIVKCKNWEATGTCKYGSVCTFAHGDTELRTKSDNNLQMSENAITMDTGFMPFQQNPYLMQDPSYIYNLMLQQQMYDMQGPQMQGMQGGNLQGQNMQMPPMNQGGMMDGQVNLNDISNPYLMGMNQMNMGGNNYPPQNNMMGNPNMMDNNMGNNMMGQGYQGQQSMMGQGMQGQQSMMGQGMQGGMQGMQGMGMPDNMNMQNQNMFMGGGTSQ